MLGEGAVGVFAGHRDGITYVDGHGDDRYVLTNSKDQTIKIWDMRKFSTKKAEVLIGYCIEVFACFVHVKLLELIFL